MRFSAFVSWVAVLLTVVTVSTVQATSKNTTGSTYPTKSGIEIWVDPATPKDRQTYTSSRGRKWDLVMSDEFNTKNRSFRPGDDHMWTSLDKPDGVNGALELYSHNMTSTACDDDDTCYFYIKTMDEVNVIHVYNMYTRPPGFQDAYFYYRAAMVQSWNKFCFQGGMLEVRAQLPGAVTEASGNPDLALGKAGKVKTAKFYPTWPGIWMMGNLGRAIFSASTNRMWPFSYNKCEPDVFRPENQRINACNDNPGYGMNPNQGRGAPEIDLLEGGGLAISSSLQIAPGMPLDYRLFPADQIGADVTNPYCVYTYDCLTPGANMIDVPTAYYKKERGHKSWYQGLRYGANNFCQQVSSEKQDYDTVSASVKAGIKENTCSVDTCPASGDVNGEISFMDATKTGHWGINSNGTCYPLMNSKKDNPQKVMLEEPMYMIYNVALSRSWGTTPPNAGSECRGDGKDPVANAICDSFPMYMKIDYIRLYQDRGDDLEADNYMQVGCDPASHPTKKWIDGHIDEYVDDDNPWKEVSGKAFCTIDDDCTIGGSVGTTALKTGKCVKNRCQCTYSTSWGGPRCTTALSGSTSTSASNLSNRAYGPPMGLSMGIAAIIVFLSVVSVYMSMMSMKKQAALLTKTNAQAKMAGSIDDVLAATIATAFTVVAAKNSSTSSSKEMGSVMSDEFNVANRSFRPGDDHLWTSLDKPDGVNGALEIYSHNMTSTKCDGDTCYFYIEVSDEPQTISVYNMYKYPPSFEDAHFYYRAAMVQSWNKFCFQGGMLEVKAQLPGAVSDKSGNPDLALGKSGKVATKAYYPTWPGIWMMGNLGRAIFSASTNRMWPFSYNKCEPDVFNPDFQRISACDDDPGYGLNPNQGRGAPEIDVLEGGGLAISSSLQIAPGMPTDFRLFPADATGADATNPFCVYSYDCKTKGANVIDVPTAYFQQMRGHKSWYQGLRYGANNYCQPDASAKQDFATVNKSVETGITDNTCTTDTCPASMDVNGDMDLIDGKGKNHWGINSNGTCYPIMNSYMGAYCVILTTPTPCMDAISSNWPIHLGIRGLSGLPSGMGHRRERIHQCGQGDAEEPMYVIFNVALSSSWGATPPNAGSECRGDGADEETNRICDEFPMYMKIDYIRLYQDLGEDLPADSYMQVGCDPKSHPTKEWIEGHIDEFSDDDNPVKTVHGKAFCKTNDDCTIGGSVGSTMLKTGTCVKSRCVCSSTSWSGPRCTEAQSGTSESSSSLSKRVYGPPMGLSMGVGSVAILLSIGSVWLAALVTAKETQKILRNKDAEREARHREAKASQLSSSDLGSSFNQPKDNYKQNFVMWAPLGIAGTFALATTLVAGKNSSVSSEYPTKSGIKIWVDPDTPNDRQMYTSSRGRQWELVMSDEFNVANRSFQPGDDHMWTSLDKPDGVNGALEIYAHNMTGTKCDDDGTCYFYIEVDSDNYTVSVYNMYKHPPGYQNSTFFYRAAMVSDTRRTTIVPKRAPKPEFHHVNASVVVEFLKTRALPRRVRVTGCEWRLGFLDGNGKNHWGINSNGTCFPIMNSYMGSYCVTLTTRTLAVLVHELHYAKSNAMDPFNYQMDAISSNWPVHLGAYTNYLVYQLEWVTGQNGYVRWMLDGNPLFEVTADAFSNVPQNSNSSNPQKVMLEEPMSLIFNFPMFMKIDYIRLYQDQGEAWTRITTCKWVVTPRATRLKNGFKAIFDEYQDDDNLATEVIGKAFCTTNSDCTVGGNYARTDLITGTCVESRCSCSYPKSWGGPRCTVAQAESTSSKASTRVYGRQSFWLWE
ncbi:Concanavalin A-like lectin/glucanase domain [Phytophthora cactorum]|nr:Concanavalin A-like lectin/glucanase domain [Phytophthora cactorum]